MNNNFIKYYYKNKIADDNFKLIFKDNFKVKHKNVRLR